MGDDPTLMASICGEFDFLDAHDFQYGDTAMVSTYIHGTKRIDYCFLSPSIASFVRRTGINLFSECYHCNHRALFLDIELKVYLGNSLPKLARPDQRVVSSRSQHVATFVSKVHAHLMENKVFHKFNDYSLDVEGLSEPRTTVTSIDNMIGHAFTSAERDGTARPSHATPGPKPYTRPASKFGTGTLP
jgi:hypothetical protein